MKSPSGFSLLELVLVILLVSLLGGVLLDRLQFYQEQAEKTAMEQTVLALRSALILQIAERLPKGRLSLNELIASNPMAWLQTKPEKYLGDRFGPAPGEIPAGCWYFDLRDNALVYVVAGRNFVANAAGKREVRLQVRNHAFKPQVVLPAADISNIDGLSLVLVEPYHWF